jgi:aspartokinase/homoserine dehydrogenase 1
LNLPRRAVALTVHKFGGTSLGSAARIAAAAELLAKSARRGRIVAVVSATAGTTNALLQAAEDARAGRKAAWRRAHAEILRRHLELDSALAGPEAQRSTSARDSRSAKSGTSGTARSRGAGLARQTSAGVAGSSAAGLARATAGGAAVRPRIEALCSELETVLSGIELLRELSDRSRDAVAAFGELLCAPLVARALILLGARAVAVDARRFLRTDDRHGRATADVSLTRREANRFLLPILARRTIPVVTGFIARGAHGQTTTLGRSGSDTSSAVLGAALGAKRIVIWTDVDGIFTADPRLVPGARLLPRLSYREASELTYFGAKVLHFPAMIPAIHERIPIVVRNSFRPACPGTLIDGRRASMGRGIAAVSAIRGLATVSLDGGGMVGVPGIAARAFSAVAREKVSVLMFSQASSEQNICLVVPEEERARSLKALREEFAAEIALGKLDGVQAHGPVAAVAAVGEGMRGTSGIAGRVFSAVARAGVNVEAIAQGSSEVNISFIVEDGDASRAVRAVHRLCLERDGDRARR